MCSNTGSASVLITCAMDRQRRTHSRGDGSTFVSRKTTVSGFATYPKDMVPKTRIVDQVEMRNLWVLIELAAKNWFKSHNLPQFIIHPITFRLSQSPVGAILARFWRSVPWIETAMVPCSTNQLYVASSVIPGNTTYGPSKNVNASVNRFSKGSSAAAIR